MDIYRIRKKLKKIVKKEGVIDHSNFNGNELTYLRNKGYIHSNPGASVCSITSKGQDWIEDSSFVFRVKKDKDFLAIVISVIAIILSILSLTISLFRG